MSTRRARIKAIAALPPRRKNVDVAAKEVVEKGVKNVNASPRNTRGSNSPLNALKSPPPSIPKARSPPQSTSKIHEEGSELNVTEQKNDSPKSEKVSVIIAANSPALSGKHSSNYDSTKKTDNQNLSEPVSEKPSKPQTSNKASTPKHNENKITTTPMNKDKNVNITDDYSVPSVPESVTSQTEESVIDGIVPIKTRSNMSKSIELLKNEIISELSEVAFDPIVPLPSPSKVRPKIRPVPRLAPHRRNSVQGSASESEDESRRAMLSSSTPVPTPAPPPPRQRHDSQSSYILPTSNQEVSRVRNDSVCSSASQLAVTQSANATSPIKDKHASKARRHGMDRRAWIRRHQTKREALTMYDLIFYNPTDNPIIPDQDEINAKEANAKEEASRDAKGQENDEDPDDPPAGDATPVPQIKLGPNGEIILDEKSLVIKQSENRKVSSVVREGSWGPGSGRYKRSARTADWCAAETVRFYRALAAIGTDFTLMAPLFPGRTRKDLYLKFKKEERLNGGQVDKALRTSMTWDADSLQDEFKQERELAAKHALEEKQRFLENKKAERERIKAARELRIRNSRGGRALESIMDPQVHNTEMTADDFAKRALENGSLDKKQKQENGLEQQVAEFEVEPPPFATLTLVSHRKEPLQNRGDDSDLATISRVDPNLASISRAEDQPKLTNMDDVVGAPSNIESGSLVVLRVNDPSSPGKTMLQTYIAHNDGKLTPVALPPTFLNSVVGYMKKGSSKSTISTASSPQLTSPSSVASQDSRSCTPGVIQLNPSPAKRQRHSSYTITPL